MQKLQCELCGSVDIIRTDDGFIRCEHCGCKYTLEQAKALLGTVETTIGTAERERLLSAVVSVLGEMTAQGGRDTEKDLFGRVGGYATNMSKNTLAHGCPVCATRRSQSSSASRRLRCGSRCSRKKRRRKS